MRVRVSRELNLHVPQQGLLHYPIRLFFSPSASGALVVLPVFIPTTLKFERFLLELGKMITSLLSSLAVILYCAAFLAPVEARPHRRVPRPEGPRERTLLGAYTVPISNGMSSNLLSAT